MIWKLKFMVIFSLLDVGFGNVVDVVYCIYYGDSSSFFGGWLGNGVGNLGKYDEVRGEVSCEFSQILIFLGKLVRQFYWL